MGVRARLKATFVGQIGVDHLSGEVDAESYERTLERGRAPADGTDPLPAGHAALPSEGDVVGGQYRLVRTLGSGMFGRVYLAERTDVPEHRVALKAINRAVYAGRNVERELVMLAAAGHPHIVELKDHGVTDDFVWLTMPLYEGETLASRLKRGPLSLREAYEIFWPVARGIEALHVRGLRHQDIKPENIFLADFAGQLHPVLLDLGVAAEKRSSFVAGTALYGAPEQVTALSGLGPGTDLSEKVDTYCLASTLLYSLVGEKHYPGMRARTAFDLASAFEVRETNPLDDDALPDLQGRARTLLSEALGRWMQRDPSERPSAGQLAEGLDVLLEQEREAKRQVERRVARQRAALQRGRIIIGAAAAVIIAAAYYFYTKRETIRLAGELEQARVEGAASFDKLDTCNAAHELSQRETRTCQQEQEQQTEEHRKKLEEVRSSVTRDRDGIAAELANTAGKLRACEDESAKLADDHTALEASIADKEAKWAEDQRQLLAERDQMEDGRKACESSAAELKREQATCRQALAACQAVQPSGPAAATGSASVSPYAE